MNRIVGMLLVALAVTTIDVAITERPVAAQPAAALGKPLPDGDLAAGTVLVRIVAGSASSPVVGVDVTLLVNAQPRQARTDAAGRATFAGLPAGATLIARVVDPDGKEISSDPFPAPSAGGLRVMLSTKPFQGSGNMPPPMGAMGGASGMPEARQMSGQPRADRGDPPGVYVVRVTYNNLTMKDGKITDEKPPVGTPVYLAAYGADDSVKILTAPTDKEGLATFTDLDQTGATAYYAMAALPRNGTVDRLIAVSAILDGQAGGRVVLSGEKQDATSPPVDDYSKLIPRDGRVLPAGQIRILLDGVPEADLTISLVDAITGKPVAVAKAKPGAPDPTQIRGSANFAPRPDQPSGSLEISVRGGAGTTMEPLPGIEVKLVTLDEQPIENTTATTGPDGIAKLKVPPNTQSKAMFVINGKQMVSAPMDLSVGGGRLDVTANWPTTGKPEATFDLAAAPGQVLYAQTTVSGMPFRSLAFQHVAEVGMSANIYVYPRTLFRFDTHSFVEDQLLAFQGEFEVTNYSWAPYRFGPDGLLIKLPKGHKGAIVASQDQSDVAVAQGEGLRLLRPIPPGGRKFRAGYSMPIKGGSVEFAFDLPLGTWQSEMKIRQTPGMTVRLPAGVQGETQTASTGEPWFVISGITIDRGKSMAMTLEGFPAEPVWKTWVPRIIGVLALMTLLGGIGYALFNPREAARAEREAKRQKLLDELVAIERDGASGKRKEQILSELEKLWGA